MRPVRRPRRQSLEGRYVLLCGGSYGIGRATAAELLRRGARVTIVARGQDGLDEAIAELEPLCTRPGQFVDARSCDTTDEVAVRGLVDAITGTHGIPDVLVNNVGYADPRYVTDYTLADFRRSLEVNVLGQVAPTLALLPHLLERGRGHIVHVSSMMGYFAIMGYAAYAPAKFGIVGFAEALRNELTPHGITVGVLYPPDTLTPGFDVENQHKPAECAQMSAGTKALSAEAVASALVDGIETRRKHILPGEAALVWRVKRFLPGLLDADLNRRHAKARRATSGAPPR